MSRSTLHDRVIDSNGVKFIKLETGRLIGFWDALRETKAGERKMWRWAARMNQLVNDDDDLERYEWFIDDIEMFVRVHRKEIEKRRGNVKVEDRIERLKAMTTDRGASEGEQENARKAIERLRARQQEST